MATPILNVSVSSLFDQFIEATTLKNILSIHHRILNLADLNPCEFNLFFPKLKRAVLSNKKGGNWKAKALFSKIDKKAAHKCYSNTKVPSRLGNHKSSILGENKQNIADETQTNAHSLNNNNALKSYNCLVIGSGPAGLRTAIELQLLGASRVVLVEKRSRFSRNNVLHLWPFVIDDLKSLGAKKFYGKFCAGSIDHISIRQLQLILLKICLMIGCDFRDSCSYLSLCPLSLKQNELIKQHVTRETESDIKDLDTSNLTFKCDLCDSSDQGGDEFTKFNDQNTDSIYDTKSNNDYQVVGNNDYQVVGNNDLKNNSTTSDSMKANEGSLITEESKNDDTHEDEGKEDKLDSPSSVPDIKLEDCVNDIIDEDDYLRRVDRLKGARAHFQTDNLNQQKELNSIEWDIIIGADGRRNTLSKFFPRKEFRGRLAIAITANFINRQTPAEASISEISGLSFIYNQDMFNSLAYDTNIELENICYYKDDTHYFVMTAKKKSLLERGVLIKDYATTQDLLSYNNVNRQALLDYARDAAYWTTGLKPLDFALNHYGQEDCAMFDFTSMYAATNACKALRTREGGLTLVSLVGDSLLEPFWPTGSGCARGFLSSFDAAWMCRQWCVNNCAVLDYHGNDVYGSRSSRNNRQEIDKPTTHNRMVMSVMAERESIYRILGQTTSENLHQNYSRWTLNPHTRYPNLNRHSVLPQQVDHLITDNINEKRNDCKKTLSPKVPRRIKSPYNNGIHRKSPKKMKSTNTLQIKEFKYDKSKPKNGLINKGIREFRSKQELTLDDAYYDFESYNILDDDHRSLSGNYLNHRKPNCDIYDDCFIPSFSGTLPSSNNMLTIEARRTRDIDDCLRQRRQKNKLSVVKNQLIDKFKNNAGDSSQTKLNSESQYGHAIFNELRKLREQQAKGKENRIKENGPLTLLNSMRRCASFAERVKSFESKLSNQNDSQTTASTAKVLIDNVKNLPEFATLQELFVNNSTSVNDSNKIKMPVMKLTKEDWNVKCWEERLAAYGEKNSKDLSGSSDCLNKKPSVESNIPANQYTKSAKQVEVFSSRIKEMADKLKREKESGRADSKNRTDKLNKSDVRPHAMNNGWVTHLRKELIESAKSQQPTKKPIVPTKMIKKLFQDDDEEDDGKHYDHLCINRPINKYLKNNYKSHLTRTKYDSVTSKVLDRQPSAESKRPYMNNLRSREVSAGTNSNYLSGGPISSSGDVFSLKHKRVMCLRCDKLVDIGDKITIDSVILHKSCITCASCGITLRTNEIQHYINASKEEKRISNRSFINYDCSICKPEIRKVLDREAADKLSEYESASFDQKESISRELNILSREEFLNQKINYNELYKNILEQDSKKESSEEIRISEDEVKPLTNANDVSYNSDEDSSSDSDHDKEYTIACSEVVDGSEQVTLVLPNDKNVETKRPLIDEDEFHRILHLDNSFNEKNLEREDETSDDNGNDGDDDYKTGDSKESSSLQSNQNSTCEDLSTAEEFVISDDDVDSDEIVQISESKNESPQSADSEKGVEVATGVEGIV